VALLPTVTQTTLDHLLLRGSGRVGLTAYGSAVALYGSMLECNPIDMATQAVDGREADIEDRGDNICICNGEPHACRLQPADLAPPTPPPEL
jgi:hypothetical protein